jgi:peroxiredoxin
LLALLTERRRKLPELYHRVLEKNVAYLRDSGLFDGALQVGETLPPFDLPSARGGTVRSADLLARGPLVVSFFRGDWCIYCRMTLTALAERHAEIEAAGGALITVTPDLTSVTEQTVRTLNLPFEVLSDPGCSFGLKCGIAYRMPDDLAEAYHAHDLAGRHGGEVLFLPIPAVFVVDRAGIVRHSYVDPEFAQRLDPDRIIDVLKTLQ